MSFPCTSCGACCRLTALIPDTTLRGYGLSRGPSGYCSHLINNRCDTYATRPDVCRIPLSDYRENADQCNEWMRAMGRTDLITEDQLRISLKDVLYEASR